MAHISIIAGDAKQILIVTIIDDAANVGGIYAIIVELAKGIALGAQSGKQHLQAVEALVQKRAVAAYGVGLF